MTNTTLDAIEQRALRAQEIAGSISPNERQKKIRATANLINCATAAALAWFECFDREEAAETAVAWARVTEEESKYYAALMEG